MTSEQIQSTVDEIAECLSGGRLDDAGMLVGTLIELCQHDPQRRDEIACMFDNVFNEWSKL